MAAVESVKEQVVDTIPKRIKELKFGIPYERNFPLNRKRINRAYIGWLPQLESGHRQSSSSRSMWSGTLCRWSQSLPIQRSPSCSKWAAWSSTGHIGQDRHLWDLRRESHTMQWPLWFRQARFAGLSHRIPEDGDQRTTEHLQSSTDLFRSPWTLLMSRRTVHVSFFKKKRGDPFFVTYADQILTICDGRKFWKKSTLNVAKLEHATLVDR